MYKNVGQSVVFVVPLGYSLGVSLGWPVVVPLYAVYCIAMSRHD